MVTLTMDGKVVQAEVRTPLIEIAEELGIEIPTLCYHPALEPYGACRLCTVEVIHRGRSRLVTACNYPAEEGIEVLTNSDRVQQARKTVLDLVLSRCSGVPLIQNLAREYGVEEPGFGKGEEECILCGLCVRVCDEIVGCQAIGFTSRGVERKVGTPFDIDSEACIGCGACAYVCPTGIITLEDVEGVRRIDLWHVSRDLQRCRFCGEYFDPVATLEYIQEKMHLPEETLEVCPNCRRRFYARRVTALGHV